MDFISLLFLFIVPLILLVWTIRFKSVLALTAVVPLLVIFAGVMFLNSDPNVLFQETINVPQNETSSVVATNVVQFDTYGSFNEMISRATSNPARGQEFLVGGADIGDKIDCVTVHMRKELAPQGTIFVGVFDGGTQGHFKSLFGTKDISTLTITSQSYQFCLEPDVYYTIQAGDVIGSMFNAGDATNYLVINTISTDTVSGSHLTRLSATGGTWTPATTNEYVSLYTFAEAETVSTIESEAVNQEVTYTLDPSMLLLLNITVMLGIIVVAFVLIRRTVASLTSNSE